jgi:hypothetical protein
MSLLYQINWLRAWSIVTLVWVTGVAFFYATPVQYQHSDALVAKRELDRSIINAKFNRCLEQQGTNWWKVFDQFKSECFKQAQETCGDARWCDAEYWRDFCIKSKVEACREIGGIVEGDASEPLLSGISWEQDNRLKQWQFYFNSRFSQPLIEAVSLAFGVPILLGIAPTAFRRLWAWLTTKR